MPYREACKHAGQFAESTFMPREDLIAKMMDSDLARSLGAEAVDRAIAAIRADQSVGRGDRGSIERHAHRRVAVGKFPPQFTAEMLATDRLVQQASSWRLATYVGRSLAALAEGGQVWDLCCGAGLDAIGAARAGARVLGVDQDALALICAYHNAALAGVADCIELRRADVAHLEIPRQAVVHIDPDRRATGRRAVRLADYVPEPSLLRSLPERTRAGAMKLSPALDPGVLADWPDLCVEHISEAGVCRQMVIWWGRAAQLRRSATVVLGTYDRPDSESIEAGLARPAQLRTPEQAGEYLIEPDPAVIAAGAVDDLAERFALRRISPCLAWCFGDRPPATALGRSFRVLRIVPGREKNIARAVKELGGGIVEVKPRGLRLDTDALQRRLRGGGDKPLAILWGGPQPKQVVFICERCE